MMLMDVAVRMLNITGKAVYTLKKKEHRGQRDSTDTYHSDS